MELLFVAVIAAGIGLIVRYIIPGRRAYGLMLLPLGTAVVACALWVALLWGGFTFDGGWIWTVSLVGCTIAAFLAAVLLPRARRASDERMRQKLGI